MRSEDHTPGIPCFPSERRLSVASSIRMSSAPISFPRSDDSRPVQPFPNVETSGVFVYWPSSSPRLVRLVLWRLTSQGISSPGSPQIRACCFPARPPHLPPWLDQWVLLCCASSPTTSALYAISVRRPTGFRYPSFPRSVTLTKLASRSSCSRFHVRSSYRGLAPHLQHAHAGRTQSLGEVLVAGAPKLSRQTFDEEDE